jgi:hypothetical protein
MTRLCALAAASLALAGCFGGWGDDDDTTPPPPPPPAPRTNKPPHIASVEIPSWPPLGPGATISVDATDDNGLSSVEARFRKLATRPASGLHKTVSFSAEELGEGKGTLRLTALDIDGASASREVESLLVDLTPPKIQLEGSLVVQPAGELRAWLGDAWVLGWAELSFKGTTLRHELPAGYPSTFGSAWDYSLVSFAAAKLPAGGGTAVLTASDAAGNVTTTSFGLRIDGDPPAVSILSPKAGATVKGAVKVELAASDPGGGRVWIEVSCGGSPAGKVAGPSAGVLLDTGDYTAGWLEIEAVAVDEAGNRSAPSSILVAID